MGQVVKCDLCGKFRKVADTAVINYSDGPFPEEACTCKWCMTPADRERRDME